MNPILMHKLAPGLAFLQIVFVRHVLRTVRASNLAFTRVKAITFNTRVRSGQTDSGRSRASVTADVVVDVTNTQHCGWH